MPEQTVKKRRVAPWIALAVAAVLGALFIVLASSDSGGTVRLMVPSLSMKSCMRP